MTKDEVIDYLDRGRALNQEIERLVDKRARLWQELNNVVPAYEVNETQFQPNPHAKEDKQALYADLYGQLSDRIDELNILNQETQTMINKLDNSLFRLILAYKHIDRMRWKDIFREINRIVRVDDRTVFRYYSQALRELGKILDKNSEAKYD